MEGTQSHKNAEDVNLVAIDGAIEGQLNLNQQNESTIEKLNHTFDEREQIRKQNKRKVLQSPVRAFKYKESL